MSLMATSFTKSGVEGLTPKAELTPVRSVGDWALAGPATNSGGGENKEPVHGRFSAGLWKQWRPANASTARGSERKQSESPLKT
jgi:hypothetical protein